MLSAIFEFAGSSISSTRYGRSRSDAMRFVSSRESGTQCGHQVARTIEIRFGFMVKRKISCFLLLLVSIREYSLIRNFGDIGDLLHVSSKDTGTVFSKHLTFFPL